MTGIEQAARAAVNQRHPAWHDNGVGIVQGSHYRKGFVDGASWLAGHLLSDETVERVKWAMARVRFELAGVRSFQVDQSDADMCEEEARAALSAVFAVFEKAQSESTDADERKAARRDAFNRLREFDESQAEPVTVTDEMVERGFQYDRLTEASDASVESARGKLYAAPCGMGTWVSVKDGTIVHGRGGNEREQWRWSKLAPWIKLDEREVEWSYLGEAARERDAAREELRTLRAALEAALSPKEEK